MRDHSKGIQQLQQEQQQQMQTPNAQQAALMRTIKTTVCSVLGLLLLANVAVHYLIGPSDRSAAANASAAAAAAAAARAASAAAAEASATARPRTLSSMSADVCNIDRLWAKNFSAEEFRLKYRLRRPLLLQFDNGSSDWLASGAQWSLDRLMEQFGSYEALVGGAIDIVRRGGRGGQRVNFGQFLRSISNLSMDETRYIFSREFFHSTHMDATLKFPAVMSYNSREHDLFLFIGGNGSGVAFHKHADAWNGVISGRKRWFLYPSERGPPGGVHHAYEPRDWLSQVLSRISEPALEPIQCVQAAGEILYIPEGFYHATINLEATIAVGIQAVKPIGTAESIFYEMQGKDANEVGAIAMRVLKILPHNTEALHKLALGRKHQEKLQEAEKMLEHVISKDASFLVAILDLAEIKWKYFGKTLEADAMYKRALDLNPNFWEVFAKNGEFLAYQTGELEKAADALEQAAKLQDDEMMVWQLLRTVHDFSGNETAAAFAAKKIAELSIIDDQLIDF